MLYQAISEYQERRIVSDIVQGASADAIRTIFDHCKPNLANVNGDKSEVCISLAEALMHYMLTVAMIPSQRKTSLHSIDIDIAIPDAKTLVSHPDDAILISFPKTKELQPIKEHVENLKKIQPNSNNIWVVLDKPALVNAKVYTLEAEQFTFANIINDLISFSSNKKQSKLKIFKI